jgi:uncharacterized protein
MANNIAHSQTVGETDLTVLLASMKPELAAEEYVFATFTDVVPASLQPLCMFRETAGTTVIVTHDSADQEKIPYTYPCRMITVAVHSDLAAIGFLAVITSKLAAKGISVNAVSAYYHDYLFVPSERAAEAILVLEALTQYYSSHSTVAA